MKAEVLREEDFRHLKLLMALSPYKPFASYPGVSVKQSLDYWYKIVLKNLIESKLNKIFVIREKGNLLGAIFIRYLKWDSKHFGFDMAEIPFCLFLNQNYSASQKIASVLLSKVINYSRNCHIRHLAVKVDPQHMDFISCLQRKRFKLVATQVVYYLALNSFKAVKKKYSFSIRPYEKKDWLKMSFLARQAFSQREYWLDRFHADCSLPNDKADNLYLRWLENCIKKIEADKVLVAELDGQTAGFICFRINKDINKIFTVHFGQVVLNAVSPAYRRRGIYTALVNEALKWLKNKNVSLATIATQMSVVPVRKTWQNLGAHLGGAQLVFHRSLKTGSK